MKVTVVGAGAVGATCADNIARKQLCSELVIVDIKEGVAEGKAMDLNQCAHIEGFDTRITGSTNDYTKTAGSAVAVITSGIPRKPGMTREELIGTNAGIVKTVTKNIKNSIKKIPVSLTIVSPLKIVSSFKSKVPKSIIIAKIIKPFSILFDKFSFIIYLPIAKLFFIILFLLKQYS